MLIDIYNTTEVDKPDYYYPIIFTLILLLLFLNYVKSKLKSYNETKAINGLQINKEEFEDDNIKKSLKRRYLICYLLARACMWARAPYLYLLFHKLHGFTYEQMGVLFLIDKTSALVISPIIGNCSDKFGRRLFSFLYGIIVVIHICLRLSVNIPCAYLSQVLAGTGATILNTTFESWINKESRKIIKKNSERQIFLESVFNLQTSYDAMSSFLISIISASLFTLFNVIAPFIFSLILAIACSISICLLWDENEKCSNEAINQTYGEALCELKKKKVLSIGLTESIFYAVLSLFIFSWTPILLVTSNNVEPNVGFVSLCFVLMTILGSLLFEILIIHLNFNIYLSLTAALIVEILLFSTIYFVNSYFIRLLCLSFINCILGFFYPLNSTIKSKVVGEMNRTLLMGMFRMPLNLFVITILLFLKYISILEVYKYLIRFVLYPRLCFAYRL
jgi:hypothetical protein